MVGDQHRPTVTVDFLRNNVRTAEVWSNASTSRATKPFQTISSVQKTFYQKPRNTLSSKILVATNNQPTVSTVSCSLCKKPHSIRQCSLFTDQTPNDRFQTTNRLQLCINCLGEGHSAAGCPSKHTWQSCKKHHHTLLHFPLNTVDSESTRQQLSLLAGAAKPLSVLLSTLLVNVSSLDRKDYTLRALLDTGAQVSFITRQCADRLSLPFRRCSTHISAFGATAVNIVCGKTSITMSPMGTTVPSIPLDVYIVSRITDAVPQSPLTTTS